MKSIILTASLAFTLAGHAHDTKPSVTILGKSADKVAPEFLHLTQKIHQTISKKSAQEKAPFKSYSDTAPLADDAEFDMIYLKGGTFTMGSPATEKDRSTDEGPQRKIKINPFWMGKVEVTWDLYHAFMEDEYNRNKNGSINHDANNQTSEPNIPQGDETFIDSLSQPTPPFHVMHYGMGDGEGYSEDYPAVSMTQHAASKFCEWLSAQTGHYYRLPTEAEWEFACRAGTTTTYSFGDDPGKLPDYAWFRSNSQLDQVYEYEYNEVGTKKANPWGLHDMYGNVAEWVLDSHLDGEKGYAPVPAGTLNPVQLSPNRYHRVVRGGHFELTADKCRSASRMVSSKMWKIYDPQNPQSIWYHTSARWVGFRIVRPATIPSVKEMHQLWNTGPGTESVK